MRLFFAINFNEKTKSRLIELLDELRARSKMGNFSTPENMHLTLSFLGECGKEQTEAAKEAMKSVVFNDFTLSVERIGRFKRDGGDIWWAGANEGKDLIALQKELSDKLRSLGFKLDDRRYSPHITLGREVVSDAAPWRIETFSEKVCSIDLMESERINGKLRYTSICCVKAMQGL
jgi:2'-5' RNA ligase